MLDVSEIPSASRPNLFVIGAQKAGTTWVFETLRRHSQIFGSQPKELFFWNRSAAGLEKHAAAYFAHFHDGCDALYRMEASANYLWTRRADNQYDDVSFQRTHGWATARQILEHIGPEARFIVLLRHPTARAISAFFHHFRRSRVSAEDRLLMVGRRYGIIDKGFYEHSTRPWLEAFDRSRFLFLLFDDIKTDPEGVIGRCLRFLKLPHERLSAPDRARNAGDGLTAHEDHLTVCAARSRAPAPRVYVEEIAFLNRIYADAVDFSEEILERDLSGWRAATLDAMTTL
jgi:hypothetical protein